MPARAAVAVAHSSRPQFATIAPPAPAARIAKAGPARQMQSALAVAVNAEKDWKEF
jgi:hypothetical protein